MNKQRVITTILIFIILIFLFYEYNQKRQCTTHTVVDMISGSVKWKPKNDYVHQRIGKCKYCLQTVILEESGHYYEVRKTKNKAKGFHEFSGQCRICKQKVKDIHPCSENKNGDCQICLGHVNHVYDENGDCRGKYCTKHRHILNIYGECKGEKCKYCVHKYVNTVGDCLGCNRHVEHVYDMKGDCIREGCDSHNHVVALIIAQKSVN